MSSFAFVLDNAGVFRKSYPYKSLQKPLAKILDGDILKWKLLDAVSTPNLESIAR
jgi:hypothetical protein